MSSQGVEPHLMGGGIKHKAATDLGAPAELLHMVIHSLAIASIYRIYGIIQCQILEPGIMAPITSPIPYATDGAGRFATICPKNHPIMLVNLPAPWSIWESMTFPQWIIHQYSGGSLGGGDGLRILRVQRGFLARYGPRVIATYGWQPEKLGYPQPVSSVSP